MQDIQFHPVTDKILHIDFYQIFDDKEITMEIPVHIIGTSKGVLAGGVLRRNLRKLRVKAIPANLPDFIEADITPLKIGSKLYVTALENEAYKFLHPDNTVVCQVRRSRAAMAVEEEEDEEEGAEGEEATAEAEA
jgi:large subunit ribosomal protein L25